jgi:hypothetical protein
MKLPAKKSLLFLLPGILFIIISFFSFLFFYKDTNKTVNKNVQIDAAYGKLPLSFEANVGQTDSQVDFLSRGSGYSLFLTPQGAVLSLSQGDKKENKTLHMDLVDVNTSEGQGVDELSGKSNYLVGNDESKWKRDIAQYSKVKYSDIYPGIDLVYYGNQRQLEYDFIVAPGADPKNVKLGFTGADKITVNTKGELVIKMGNGELKLNKPLTYQEKNGVKKEIASSYAIKDNQIAFNVGEYDKTQALVIDPVLEYSTYLGGNNTDTAWSLVVDSQGNTYISGSTISTNFPTVNAFQSTFGGGFGGDIFVTKLNSSGSALVYSTYIGGNNSELGLDIAVDASGSAYVAGRTSSTNFPTVNPIQSSLNGGGDIFILKLSNTGSSLDYSTYLGGSNFETAEGIAVDVNDNAYVSGSTGSTNFPTVNPIQGAQQNGDAFVTKINPAGSAMVYSTYLGGSSSEGSEDIKVNSQGEAFVTGNTNSTNFPTVNPIQATPQDASEGFITKINASGSAFVYSTYLGGNDFDNFRRIAIGSDDSIYVTGGTRSTNFPLMNPIQSTFGGGSLDVFITKLNSSGSALVYSTYLGGIGSDFGWGLDVDSIGNAYVTGETQSGDFPLADAIQSSYAGNEDGFVAKLNPQGSALIYSTYLGGSQQDTSYGIASDSNGNAYVAGATISSNFPLANPFDASLAGQDAFVAKIVDALPTPTPTSTPTSTPTPTPTPQPVTLTFDSSADTYVRSGQANHNQGGDGFMNIQSSGDNRSLVKFDQGAIASAVGSGAVLSAKLRVTIVDNGNNWGTTGRTVDLHRLISDWTEGNGTENDRGEGNGATWNCAIDSLIENQAKNCTGVTEWEMGMPGNPSVHPWIQTATDSETITNNQSGIVEYDVTTDVQSFLNATNNNYGWIIKKTNESQNGQVSFGTRESSSIPQLVVTYQP